MSDESHDQSDTERRQDPWETARGFRAVPAMDGANRVTVEVDCPDREVILTTGEALELAEHLTRVARTALAWKGARS